ncbi:MAG: serine/threonine protein kinase [Pyrinomonadaceae bacterium]|nr:serine/threonine protein kinase [Pyrinomonadaceae bacterium]
MIQAKALERNTVLQGRYLIVSLIGSGGMGEVYLAVDQRLGNKVAIKRAFFGDEERLAQAFEREAKILAQLKHPNLPKVIDHFEEGGAKYLVMEYIAGSDLARMVKENGKPFTLDWVLFWADQLLEVLNYLHSQRPPIIHRDIKPQNLKLTPDNNVVLLDFGLAKFSVGEKTRVSSDGSTIAYTPSYAPIEQIRRSGTTERSDIYSLSATIYFLLTAQNPIDSVTRADRLLNNLPDPIEPINKLNPEVPEEISDVIMRGMSVASNLRYDSAKEMQKALREAFFTIKNRGVSHSKVNVEAVDNKRKQSEQKTLVLEDLQLSNRTLTESTPFSQSQKETRVIPEEIFPKVVSQDLPREKQELTIPLVQQEELLQEKQELTVPLVGQEELLQNKQELTVPLVRFDEFSEEAKLVERAGELKLEEIRDFENQPTSYRVDFQTETTDFQVSERNELEAAQLEDKDFRQEAVSVTGTYNQPHTEATPVASSQNVKSRSSALVILLSAFVVFILGATIVGFGLYVLGDRIFSSTTPTAAPTPVFIPTPEVTPQLSETPILSQEELPTEGNLDLRNGNQDTSNANQITDTSSSSSAPSQIDRRQQQQDRTRTVTRQESVEKPRKEPKNTTTKPTPAKAPDRLEILQ